MSEVISNAAGQRLDVADPKVAMTATTMGVHRIGLCAALSPHPRDRIAGHPRDGFCWRNGYELTKDAANDIVIPAEAGIQCLPRPLDTLRAFAGMTRLVENSPTESGRGCGAYAEQRANIRGDQLRRRELRPVAATG